MKKIMNKTLVMLAGAAWSSSRWRRSRKSRSAKICAMTSLRTLVAAIACVAVAGLAIVGCGSKGTNQQQPQELKINGAGATFPFPIYSKWFDEYHKLHPEVQINYQSVGSGAGIRQVTNQTVF